MKIMNKKLWLLSIGFLSFTAYAESNQPNPYVTNSQQLIDSSSAQAKQNLYKAYPPPVAMTPVTPAKIGGGTNTQPPAIPVPPSVSPPQPTENQPMTSTDTSQTTPTAGSTDQQVTQQPTYQENVAVTPDNNSAPSGSTSPPSGGVSTGNNSASSNMYR